MPNNYFDTLFVAEYPRRMYRKEFLYREGLPLHSEPERILDDVDLTIISGSWRRIRGFFQESWISVG